MFVFAAWFVDPTEPASDTRARWRRARHYLGSHTPASWSEQIWQGAGWGIVVRQAKPGGWRWTFADEVNGVTAVASGFPIGLTANDPVELGRRLLRGDDIHVDVAAPFALLTVEQSTGRVAVQQDWHGMGQMFLRRDGGSVAFSNRPSLLPTIAGEPARPHRRGWARYLANGNFAGNTSPIRGVRLLAQGERMTGRLDTTRGWDFGSEQRRNVDDMVTEALADRPPLNHIAERVAAGVQRAADSLTRIWPDPLGMGLSGGEDSRLLAAMLLNTGAITRFVTNEDNPLEGETAARLIGLLSEHRGLTFEHERYRASASEKVLDASLLERGRQLQRRNDFMFRSTYLNRPVEPQLPGVMPSPRILGLMGEYVSGYWIPQDWKRDPSIATPDGARAVLQHKLFGAGPRNALRPATRRVLDEFIDSLLAKAHGLGLDPFGTVCYGYLNGRNRRASSALTHVEQLMPLAVPEVLSAGFQLTPQQKSESALHRAIIGRFVPEWLGVPFVANSSGVKDADRLRVWHGTGAEDLAQLIEAPEGELTSMFNRRMVQAALDTAKAGGGTKREDALLRQFTMAAVAELEFAELNQAEASATSKLLRAIRKA